MRRNQRITGRDFLAEAKRRGWPIRMGKGDHCLVTPPDGRPISIIVGSKMNRTAPPRAMKVLRDTP